MLFLFFFLACSSDQAPAPPLALKTYTRMQLPAVTTPYLPKQGLVLVSGGPDHLPQRIIVDFHGQTMNQATGKRKGGSAWSSVQGQQRKLEKAELFVIKKLWDKAFQEQQQPPGEQKNPYKEMLYLADGENIRMIRGYGPIKQPSAQALVDMLFQKAKEFPPTKQEKTNKAPKP